jgi:hypothetical protein
MKKDLPARQRNPVRQCSREAVDQLARYGAEEHDIVRDRAEWVFGMGVLGIRRSGQMRAQGLDRDGVLERLEDPAPELPQRGPDLTVGKAG